jgi:hypothetical protein
MVVADCLRLAWQYHAFDQYRDRCRIVSRIMIGVALPISMDRVARNAIGAIVPP